MAKLRGIEGGDVVAMEEANPKLLCMEEEVRSVKFIKDIESFFEPRESIYIATFLPMRLSNFANSYVALQDGLLKQTRIVKEKVYLNPLEVKDFDHAKPVYLARYSCYFYVNKVSNYQPGKLTDVELVALKLIS